MKLSEKGFEKILDTCHFDEDRATYALNYSWPKKDYHFEIQGTEFEPDDFKGMVCLTVDEIFTLKQMVQWVMKSSKLNNMNKVFLEKTYNFLNERFEKAEKGNEVE